MIGQKEVGDQESDSLLGLQERHHKGKKKGWMIYFLILSLSLNLFILGVGFSFYIHNYKTLRQSYELGFTSDLESVKPEIELTQYRFTGGVRVNESGHFSTDHSSSSSQYVGPPSPEIDHAWGELLAGLNIDLDTSEANYLNGRTYQWPDTGSYFTGLEVFHSLHCLNRLRQALYPEYYHVFNNPNDPSREDHIGHCINHLRQAIQCHADLTPMEWELIGKKLILKTDSVHTCRNFDVIRDWATEKRTKFTKLRAMLIGDISIVD